MRSNSQAGTEPANRGGNFVHGCAAVAQNEALANGFARAKGRKRPQPELLARSTLGDFTVCDPVLSNNANDIAGMRPLD